MLNIYKLNKDKLSSTQRKSVTFKPNLAGIKRFIEDENYLTVAPAQLGNNIPPCFSA